MNSQPMRALVTGSTRGIGWAIARELAQRGLRVVLNYRDDEACAQRALAELSRVAPSAELVRSDVCSESGIDLLFRRALQAGPVDVLVNTVGEFLHVPFLQATREDWERILCSNLLSAVRSCQLVLPSMREQKRGHIINIASMHADRFRARPNTLAYTVAKTGIIHLTHALAKTEAVYGIRVNAVAPGFVDGGEHTQAKHRELVPLGRLGQAEDIARAVAFLLSPDADYMTGAILEIHGGALL